MNQTILESKHYYSRYELRDQLNKKLKHIYECEYAQFVRKHITNDSERGSRASYCRCNIDYQQIENYKIFIFKLKE